MSSHAGSARRRWPRSIPRRSSRPRAGSGIAGDGMTMLSIFWAAARTLDPAVVGERVRPGVARGDLAQRFRRAGLRDVVEGAVEARVDYADYDDFWQPFTFGVGPAGEHLASLPAEAQAR